MYVSKTQERKGELVFPRISCLGAWINKADKSDRIRERKQMVAVIVPPIRSQRQEQDQQRFYNMYILFYSLFLKKITSQYWIFLQRKGPHIEGYYLYVGSLFLLFKKKVFYIYNFIDICL